MLLLNKYWLTDVQIACSTWDFMIALEQIGTSMTPSKQRP